MNENTSSEYYLLVEDGSNPEIEYRNPDYNLDRSLSLYRHIILPDDYQMIDLYLMGRISKLKVDYLTLFGLEHVVSERVKLAIEEMNPVNIQFLPTIIHGQKEDHEDYFIINCYNAIPAMDKKKSEWTKSGNPDPGREVQSIDKLVLDPDKIKDIPLSERLIVALGECMWYTLFHESVIENIEKLKPKGFYAVPVDAWDSDLMMDL